jgi:tetratricopeptide (TPR) repeat protein
MVSSTRTERRLLLALALVFATPVLADKVTAQARAAALDGTKAFDTNDFVTAIAKYEEAYRLKPAPGLLFNLAQSHRRAGHLDDALSYFRRYLETDPPKNQAEAVEKLVVQVEQERTAAKEAMEKAARDAQEKAEREEQERREREATQRVREVEDAKRATAQAEADAARRRLDLERVLKEREAARAPPPVYQRWWFWGAIGVVVAGAVGTTVYVATEPKPAPTTFPDINAR